jgi:hypothetical protein
MRKLILALFFLGAANYSPAQKGLTCEFSDTLFAKLPDSVFASMLTNARPDIQIPADVMADFLSQTKLKLPNMTQKRIVRAEIDQTIISTDRSSRSGNLTMETFDSLLYRGDELFRDSASANGFTNSPTDRPRKQFLATGKKKIILTYSCDEYLSTDSTCYIWVTKELPDTINPGIRKGNIKGAVLGFELTDVAFITKSILIRFGRGL